MVISKLNYKQRLGVSVWQQSRKNLSKLSRGNHDKLLSLVQKLSPDLNISRIIIPPRVIKAIESGKLDLDKDVSLVDLQAAVKKRTLFSGNVLDLNYLHRVKRGPVQVVGSILGAYIRLKVPALNKEKYDYAFMVHPRAYADVLRGVPFLKYIPEKLGRAFVKRLPPFKLSNMTGLSDVNGKPLTGALMCIGWDREMFESDQLGREEKIADLVLLAKNMGIEYTGFAALLPWASRYGQCLEGTVAKAVFDQIVAGSGLTQTQIAELFENSGEINLKPKPLLDNLPRVADLNINRKIKKELRSLLKWADIVGKSLSDTTITTGHPFTVSIIASYVKKVRELHPKKSPLIAIVGAAGSTGSCCSIKIIEDGADNLLLVDKIKSTGVTNLGELDVTIKQINPKAKVELSTDLSDLKKADIVIVVSSAKGTIVNSEHLKPGAIVIDDSQPRNVDPKIAQERQDIRIVTVLAPLDGLIPDFYFDKHTPFTEATYTCAGDVYSRAATFTEISATGPATMAGVRVVEEMITKMKEATGLDLVRPVFYTYNRKVVSCEDIEKITALSI